jgi:hypothetical protein
LVRIEHVAARRRGPLPPRAVGALPGSAGDARRVGTHEERCDDLTVRAKLRDVHREVMALEAPAPGVRTTGPAKSVR